MDMMYQPDMDPRRAKRIERIMYGGEADLSIMRAEGLGRDAHYRRAGKRNPYPAGTRHDAFERAYREADPMGDFMGRNI